MHGVIICSATLAFLVTGDCFGEAPSAKPGTPPQAAAAGSDSMAMESPSSDATRFGASDKREATLAGERLPNMVPALPVETAEPPAPRLIAPGSPASRPVAAGPAPVVLPILPEQVPEPPAPRLIVPRPPAPQPVAVEPVPIVVPAPVPVRTEERSVTAAATAADETPERAPAASTVDEERQQRIGNLLEKAEVAYREKRLTTPKGDAAADYYRQVMALEPDNEAAHQGMEKISARYVRWGLTAVSRGRLARARLFRERAESVRRGSTARLGDAIRRAEARAGRRPSRSSRPFNNQATEPA